MNFEIDLVTQYVPIIVSLFIMEGLLSVDNAMIIAAMVNHLPENQRKAALKAGLLGAYFFRGLLLFFAEELIKIWWLKFLGAAYLIYLMISHLGTESNDKLSNDQGVEHKKKGFWMTVLAVELADLAFSIDNIIAAVALSSELWVVITGVFLGIAAMRFVAGFFIELMEKYPVLKPTAYVLVGFVGALLIYQELFHVHTPAYIKFLIIGTVIVFAFTTRKMRKCNLCLVQPLDCFVSYAAMS